MEFFSKWFEAEMKAPDFFKIKLKTTWPNILLYYVDFEQNKNLAKQNSALFLAYETLILSS